MQLELKVWAHDILTAIREIETFLEDVGDFSAYQTDLKQNGLLRGTWK
jgi:hypothetical protein